MVRDKAYWSTTDQTQLVNIMTRLDAARLEYTINKWDERRVWQLVTDGSKLLRAFSEGKFNGQS